MDEPQDAGRETVAASDEIALCLSGGGYRAAAFHLGTLDMLERLGLLGKVKVLATISGGTITGVLWTLARGPRRRPSATFSAASTAACSRINVVRDAFAGLEATSAGGRRPSLARAAAEIYAGPALRRRRPARRADGFAGGARTTCFSAAPRCPPGWPSGSRPAGARSSSVVGTRDVLEVPRELARELRLGDVIAASACFPGAFEPMLFPSDFVLGPAPAAQLGELQEVAGLDTARTCRCRWSTAGCSTTRASTRRRRAYDRVGAAPGLVLVSDSSPRGERHLPATARARRPAASASASSNGSPAAWPRWRRLQALSIGRDVWPEGWRLTDAIALGTCLAIFGGLYFGRQRLLQLLAKVREVTGVAVWDGLEKISLGELIELVDRRARSLVSITSTVFLKRVRSLQQRLCFVDSKLRDRVVFSLIYTLLEPSKAPRSSSIPAWPLGAALAAARRSGRKGRHRAVDRRGRRAARHHRRRPGDHPRKLLELHHLGRLPAVQGILGPGFEVRAEALWEQLQQDPESLLRDPHAAAGRRSSSWLTGTTAMPAAFARGSSLRRADRVSA